jgi:hypothetical protein
MKQFIINSSWHIYYIVIIFVSYKEVIVKQNLAYALFAGLLLSSCLFISYNMWKRGDTNSMIFGDISQIEKDLREIQKLEIKKKLNNLKKEDDEIKRINRKATKIS